MVQPMRDEGGAEILEWLAAGDVVVVMMAVDDVFDRLVGDRLDRVDIGLGGSQVGDRVGCDHALRRHHEHRLMAAIAEDVDIVGAVDLSGGGLRRGLRECRSGHEGSENGHASQCFHLWLSGNNEDGQSLRYKRCWKGFIPSPHATNLSRERPGTRPQM
ncbi:hypothetical protein LUR18_25515 [Bradyrhizobium diazoefficiens]|nr:hypothetical protein [Bradyrhizobium diazoefficiens]MCD9295934.1 hypothetical protein [Bradyrhizobium diazoefficiens]